MAVYTYDPSQVVLTVDGTPISGFTDGTFITVARDEDAYTKVVGADGQVSRARNTNKSGSVTITLKQTSASNDVLSAMAEADDAGGDKVAMVQIKDMNGETKVTSSAAWIKKFPDMEFGKEVSDRVWILDCDALTIKLRGNKSSS